MRKILNYLDKEGLKYLIAKIKSEINNKVDKVDGKSLSTNDFTTTEKNKLAGIATNANNYVLPTASATVLGGIKVGSNLTIVNGVLSAKDGIALGTTSSTAFRGDYGNTAYTHSQKTSGNPHKVTKSDVGLGNVDNTADANKSVKYATTAGDAATVSGHTVAKDVPSNAVFTDTNTWVKASTTADGYISKLSGNTSQFLRGDGTWATPPNTTYGLATSSANGLLSSADFTKLSKVTATEMGYLSGATGSIQNQINNTLSKTNTIEYIPTSDYHPATKIYVDNKVKEVIYIPNEVISMITDSVQHTEEEWAQLWFPGEEDALQKLLNLFDKLVTGEPLMFFKAFGSTRVYPVAYSIGKKTSPYIGYNNLQFCIYGPEQVYENRFMGTFRTDSPTRTVKRNSERLSLFPQISQYSSLTTECNYPSLYNNIENPNLYNEDSFIIENASMNGGTVNQSSTSNVLMIKLNKSYSKLFFTSTYIRNNLSNPFNRIYICNNLFIGKSVTIGVNSTGNAYSITGSSNEGGYIAFEYNKDNAEAIDSFTLIMNDFPTETYARNNPTYLEIDGLTESNERTKIGFNSVAISNRTPKNGEQIWIKKGKKNLFDKNNIIDNTRFSSSEGYVTNENYFIYKTTLTSYNLYRLKTTYAKVTNYSTKASDSTSFLDSALNGTILPIKDSECIFTFQKDATTDLETQLENITLLMNMEDDNFSDDTLLYLQDNLGKYYLAANLSNVASKDYVDEKVGKIDFDKIYTMSWLSDGNNSGFGLVIDGITALEDIRNKEIKFTTQFSNITQSALNSTTNFIIKNKKGETFIKKLPFRTFINGGIHTLTYDDNNNIVINDYVKALRLWYEGIFARKLSSFSSLENMAYYFDFPDGDSLVTELVQAVQGGKPVMFYHNNKVSYPGSLYLETASNSRHPFKIKKMTLTCYAGTTIETAQFTYDSTSKTMLATYTTKTL